MVSSIEQLLNKYRWNARTNARTSNIQVRGRKLGEFRSAHSPQAALLRRKGFSLASSRSAPFSCRHPRGGFLPHLLPSWGPRPTLSLPWQRAGAGGQSSCTFINDTLMKITLDTSLYTLLIISLGLIARRGIAELKGMCT